MDDLIGKYPLIGITFLDKEGNVVEQFQTHGPITSADALKGIVIEKPDGSGEFCIPPDRKALTPASKGQYRLRTTGEIVDDPDFTTTWTVGDTEPSNSEALEEYKRSGFKMFFGGGGSAKRSP